MNDWEKGDIIKVLKPHDLALLNMQGHVTVSPGDILLYVDWTGWDEAAINVPVYSMTFLYEEQLVESWLGDDGSFARYFEKINNNE